MKIKMLCAAILIASCGASFGHADPIRVGYDLGHAKKKSIGYEWFLNLFKISSISENQRDSGDFDDDDPEWEWPASFQLVEGDYDDIDDDWGVKSILFSDAALS